MEDISFTVCISKGLRCSNLVSLLQPANISEVEVAFSVEKPQLKRIVCTAEQFLNIRVKSFTSDV